MTRFTQNNLFGAFIFLMLAGMCSQIIRQSTLHDYGMEEVNALSYQADIDIFREMGPDSIDSNLIVRISESSAGDQGNGDSYADFQSMSADGKYVVYASSASNLVANDTNNALDVFLFDRDTGQTTRVSLTSGGNQTNGTSYWPSISANGRYITYVSVASNIVSGDDVFICDNDGDGQANENCRDIFVYDRNTGTTSLVSIALDGSVGNGLSALMHGPAISADGRYIAFESSATDLVAGDVNGRPDIFLRDTQTNQTTLISVSTTGIQGNGQSATPSVSPSGRYVAYLSWSNNLTANDTNGEIDVFLFDGLIGETICLSLNLNGLPANGSSTWPFFSANEQFVIFSSDASDLVSNDNNGVGDVFRHNRQTGETILVSQNSNNNPGNGRSRFGTASADGRFVAFQSDADNLDTDQNDTNGSTDVFVRDIDTNTTKRVSLSVNDQQGIGNSYVGQISDDSLFVVFRSFAENLILSDNNNRSDIFIRDWTNEDPAPANVVDLFPYTTQSPIQAELRWHAPGADGESGGPAAEYDIRYSDAPINESNWDFASQVSGEPTPAEPGTEERWIIPAILGVNQHWYFALKTADNAGRWSEISNVSSLLANGFRPNPNGYQDSNFAGIVGDDFTIDDMREMFGDRTVCTKTWPTCLPRVGALAWRGLALLSMERGRCAGMAATSLRFFDGLETPSQFQDGAHFPYDIENIEGNMDIRKYIAYYHAEQVGLPILGYRTREESTSTPAETLHELQDALTNGESMVLIIKKNNGPGGHAVTPYAIQERGDGKWFIIIYDNENPNKQIPIFVNEISNTWNYGEEGFVSDWFGDEHTHSLYNDPQKLDHMLRRNICAKMSMWRQYEQQETGQKKCGIQVPSSAGGSQGAENLK